MALLDRGEKRHLACAQAIDLVQAPLITCEPVIAEACFFAALSCRCG
ncbi:MAG: PIN domain nuclease [Candidatus Acidiferrum sp.]|jgi:hypothetical protein